MRFFKIIIIAILVSAFVACGEKQKPASPVETLKAYTIAVKKKDVTTMKLLLSSGSLKIHQQEAKAQNVTVDDIVLRDTLFPPDQRVFDYKNEKIEGEKATVEVKNNFDGWDIVHLVKEDGIWKIDKKATSEQMIQEVETSNDNLEEQIKQDMEKAEQGTEQPDLASPDASASPTPENPANPTNPTNPNPNPSPNNPNAPPPVNPNS